MNVIKLNTLLNDEKLANRFLQERETEFRTIHKIYTKRNFKMNLIKHTTEY